MCKCGDLYCLSCGPAQGNWQCEVCGKWLFDGGCDNPHECNEKYEKMLKARYEEMEEAKHYCGDDHDTATASV